MGLRDRLQRLVGEPTDLGELFHRRVIRGKAVDLGTLGKRTAAIAGRLNAVRAPRPEKRAYVVRDLEHEALTVPGRHVYVSHGLAGALEADDALAFVIAHEMAHHDLGHLMNRLATIPATMTFAQILYGISSRLVGPERELAADARAMELCLAAGYDRDRCLTALELFLGAPEQPAGIRSHPPVRTRLDRLRA